MAIRRPPVFVYRVEPVHNTWGPKLLAAACLFALLIASCRPEHTAQKTVQGPHAELPPEMSSPAPAAIATIGELRAPESVLYDPGQDVYFISNINGGMLDADNNGFISRVDAATMQVNVKWIEGGRNGVTLDGPKGSTIVGETLYVADVKAVRKFNRRTGAPEGAVTLPGATFINDLTTDGTSVYASDTGILIGPGNTLADTGTDAIWKITGDRAEKIASGRKELDHPNGLDWVDGKLRVVTFGPDALYELSGGKRNDLAHFPKPQLDGLVHLPNGDVVVTSWEGNEIYRGPLKGPFAPILGGVAKPADIGYDTKRHRLLVPLPANNQVTIHAVQ